METGRATTPTSDPLALLAKALRQAWVYDGEWSPHRQRTHGRPPTGLTGYQFVVCTQNHDQVGNRALGERSSALMSDGRLRVAAALLLTGPFTPMLFQGEEWGATSPFQYFTDHHDPDLGAAVSDGRRRGVRLLRLGPRRDTRSPGPCDLRSVEAGWDELEQPAHASLLAWYRELIALRRRLPALSDPRLSTVAVEVDEADQTLVVHRGNVTLYVNLSERHRRFASPPDGSLVAASDRSIGIDGDLVVVPPDAVALVVTTED